jgi:hypothetical protein
VVLMEETPFMKETSFSIALVWSIKPL